MNESVDYPSIRRRVVMTSIVVYNIIVASIVFLLIKFQGNIITIIFLVIIAILSFYEFQHSYYQVRYYFLINNKSYKLLFHNYRRMRKISKFTINIFKTTIPLFLWFFVVVIFLSTVFTLTLIPVALYAMARALESEIRLNFPVYLLYLSSSDERNLNDCTIFYKASMPLRFCHLLKEHSASRWTEKQSLRVKDDKDWKLVVEQLMELSKIIVVNLDNQTISLEYEIGLIDTKNYHFKTIFYLRTVDRSFDREFKDSIYIAGDRKLAEFLVSLTKGESFLNQPEKNNPISAVFTRHEKQLQGNGPPLPSAVWRKIRGESRTGYTSLDYLSKGMSMANKVQWKFIKKFKGSIGYYNPAKGLLEDIPSKFSIEEEKEWLEQNEELNEIESLFKNSIEIESKTPGPNQSFNIASTFSKLGALYRFRREWDQAIYHISEAISRFSKISDQDIETQREIAIAYYLLGEVYMAKYRLEGTEQDRLNAEKYFNLTIEIDTANKKESELSKRRLSEL